MSNSTTMLYKAPGPHEIHGGNFDYTIVEDDQIDAALAAGWYLTTTEAKAAHQAALQDAADNAPPTRDELKRKADELGLQYPGNIPTERLGAMVDAALKV
jgi:hypothetical protein